MCVGSRLLSVAILLAGSLHAQTEIRRGDWRAVLGQAGLESLHFQDQPVCRGGRYAGYLPDWKGTTFTMDGAELQVDGNRATWHKGEAGKQDATITLELTEDGAIYRLQTVLTVPGPSELGLMFSPNFLRADNEGAFVWYDGTATRVPLGPAVVPTVNLKDKAVYETPDATIELLAPNTQVQDRRQRGQDIYVVRVVGGGGAEPRPVETAFTIVRQPVPPEQIAGRALYLAQVPRTERELPLRNADFAAGLEGWNQGRAVSPVAEGYKDTPGACIQAATPPAATNEVYLTQMVPVVPGAEYQLTGMVRTRDVKPAAIGGMESVGATIILEFADPQGKWFAGGAYAKGLYGDRDWQRLTTNETRAPEGAGFAILYLALRATGTAWFDDVALREVRRFPVLESPLPGSRVADNTPTFVWQHDPRDAVRLELCPTPGFAADVVSYAVPAAPPFAVPEPLPPGTWHWRIRPPSAAADSAVWSFVQTAALTEDCTPPAIEPAHGFLPEPRTALRIPVSDNRAVVRAELVVDGRAVTAQIGDGAVLWTPDQDWGSGLHRVQVKAFDAAGAEASRLLYFTHANGLRPRVWLRERGCLLGAAPEFPLGMYGVRIEDMPEMARAGFDLVHNYAWDGSGSLESAIAYLDAAQANGLHVFMGLDRQRLLADDFDFVAERVGALMLHPALYAWYLFDEPDLPHQYLAPERLARLHQLIARLDPFHPIILTCAGDPAVPQYRDSGTVYWTQVYGETRVVARRLPKNRQDLRPETAHAAILHCYDRAQSNAYREGGAVDIAAFQPDPATLRANAFMALTEGSSGLLWWWWGQGSRHTLTISQAPEPWQALQGVVADIRALRPLLAAAGQTQQQILTPQDGVEIHVLEKRVGDRVLLIAVNRDKQEVELDLPLQLAPAQAAATLRIGQGPVGTTGGVLHYRFPPLGVLVAEWP